MNSDREKLVELLNNSFDEQYRKRGLLTAPHTADRLIANGVTIRGKGEWILRVDEYDYEYIVCPLCEVEVELYGGDNDTYDSPLPNYCPNCGAKMDLHEPPKEET